MDPARRGAQCVNNGLSVPDPLGWGGGRWGAAQSCGDPTVGSGEETHLHLQTRPELSLVQPERSPAGKAEDESGGGPPGRPCPPPGQVTHAAHGQSRGASSQFKDQDPGLAVSPRLRRGATCRPPHDVSPQKIGESFVPGKSHGG